MTRILSLHVRAEYFEEIRAGRKTEEYREFGAYWGARIAGRVNDEVHILLGYPRASEHEKRLVFPWTGYSVKEITHPEFGATPVIVYAVNLQHQMVKSCD
jgi:hypothetical protein